MMPSDSPDPAAAAPAVADDRSRFRWGNGAAIAGSVMGTILVLRAFGRRWWCACGGYGIWSGDARGAHNSQHLLDPYALTHLEHGFLLFWLFTWLTPRWSFARRMAATVGLESLWELVENSPWIIERYRTATVAQGYSGDSLGNVLGDLAACALGFWLAGKLGGLRTTVLAVVIEVLLLLWIRDNLLLNVLMLAWPIGAVRTWQGG